ncbi:hypothetical protein EDD16DRAFT_567614 [Pisolithus croceorrhizus]|nr:hypothetical protein EDD16DRAFT_567614 [Pisolithus croceorrhizus]
MLLFSALTIYVIICPFLHPEDMDPPYIPHTFIPLCSVLRCCYPLLSTSVKAYQVQPFFPILVCSLLYLHHVILVCATNCHAPTSSYHLFLCFWLVMLSLDVSQRCPGHDILLAYWLLKAKCVYLSDIFYICSLSVCCVRQSRCDDGS